MERMGIHCPECGTPFGVWIGADGAVQTEGCSYVLISAAHRPLTADEIIGQIETEVGPGQAGSYHLSPKALKTN
jgi:hypothetical protein